MEEKQKFWLNSSARQLFDGKICIQLNGTLVVKSEDSRSEDMRSWVGHVILLLLVELLIQEDGGRF